MKKDVKTNQNEVTTGEPLEKGGYFVAYNLVMRNAMKVFDLNSGEYSCLTMLFSYAGADKDKCFPSQDALAVDLNIKDARTVRRYLEGLEKKGAIIIYNRQNKNDYKISNLYDLSPCLAKIRELYCSNQEKVGDFGIKISKKSSNEGQDKIVLSENTGSEASEASECYSEENSEFGEPYNEGQDISVLSNFSDRTEMSEQTGQICPTTSNTIHITNNINNNKDYIDDDKRTFPSEKLSAGHNEENINMIISSFREATKDDMSDRTFKSVLRKVIDKYNQGKIGEGKFRDYLSTSLANKIEALEIRRMKEQAKSEIGESKIKRSAQRVDEYMNRINELESSESTEVSTYNWLENC